MPNTEPFDKYSDEYDEWFERNAELYQAELETVRQLIPSADAEGMEVGVGSGKFAAPLGIRIGIEPSKKMADRAREKGINVYPGIAEKLPFNDARFDYILMVTTICFVDDVLKSFKEAFRVLKPGGCIIVGFVDKESQLGKQYTADKEKNKFYKDATFFSTEEVLKYLKKAAFEILRIRQTLIPEESTSTIRDGFGKGSFVVIRALKNKTSREKETGQGLSS
ncbi:MAG: methyltransferase domain-containing protein [candidate division Zixibacteria bacterium]|nr:methyltransferase domain-containing protein [candidate division Zixibacteria bacterium]